MNRAYRFSLFISTFFYVGKFPAAPGTAGSFAALVLYVALFHFFTPFEYILLFAVIFITGIYTSGYVERTLGEQDPSFIVIDEVAGYILTMAGALLYPFSFINAIAGFVIFRFFDILKPFPVKYIDRKVKGGIGIMLDDIVAAIFSAIILRIFIYISKGM